VPTKIKTRSLKNQRLRHPLNRAAKATKKGFSLPVCGGPLDV
jgi:hypothetical protein